MLSPNTRYFCQSRVSDRLLTIVIEDSDDFSRFLWENTQIIFPTDHNLFSSSLFPLHCTQFQSRNKGGASEGPCLRCSVFWGRKMEKITK